MIDFARLRSPTFFGDSTRVCASRSSPPSVEHVPELVVVRRRERERPVALAHGGPIHAVERAIVIAILDGLPTRNRTALARAAQASAKAAAPPSSPARSLAHLPPDHACMVEHRASASAMNANARRSVRSSSSGSRVRRAAGRAGKSRCSKVRRASISVSGLHQHRDLARLFHERSRLRVLTPLPPSSRERRAASVEKTPSEMALSADRHLADAPAAQLRHSILGRAARAAAR